MKQGRDINHNSEEAKEERKTEELKGEAITMEKNQDGAEKNGEARNKTHIYKRREDTKVPKRQRMRDKKGGWK